MFIIDHIKRFLDDWMQKEYERYVWDIGDYLPDTLYDLSDEPRKQ